MQGLAERGRVDQLGRRDFCSAAALAGATFANLSETAAQQTTAASAQASETEAHVVSESSHIPGDPTTAEILVDTLLRWSVSHVFGMVGDGINPIVEALRKRKGEIEFVGVRHEEAAAFMAGGFAKHTGKLGVCLGTTGPGAIHLMNGLYDAHYDGAPVLAITGTTFHDLIGTPVHARCRHREVDGAGCGTQYPNQWPRPCVDRGQPCLPDRAGKSLCGAHHHSQRSPGHEAVG